MASNTIPEVEVKWPGGSFRAAGALALILTAALVAAFGIAYLAITNWERILG